MPSVAMEIEIEAAGADIRASGRHGDVEKTPWRALGKSTSDFTSFAAAVSTLAASGKPLPPDLRNTAQSLQTAVLQRDIDALRARLAGDGQKPVLLRLALPPGELQDVPWEALCAPDQAMGFWATSPDVFPVRGVTTTEPLPPREIRGALSVLAVAPDGGRSLDALKLALDQRINAGEIEWLPPITGPDATVTTLFNRLNSGRTNPNVIHFLCHGGQKDGVAAVRLAGREEDSATWLSVELLAQQLKSSLRGFLRLILLESCEGARSSSFASAAEILARAGADAVVAHLWPVKADVARACSENLYRALTSDGPTQGDIAASMNQARRALLGSFDASAEAFSPIIYLRSPTGLLFEFKRKPGAPTQAPASSTTAPKSTSKALDPVALELLRQSFSLVLGDRTEEQIAAESGFRDRLREALTQAAVPAPPDLPLATLAQRFVMHNGTDSLNEEFQSAFTGESDGPPPFLDGIAKGLGAGPHITLLRLPWLEQAVAKAQPNRMIYVIQLGGGRVTLRTREPGGAWKKLERPPSSFDMQKEMVLLRLYGGYLPPRLIFSQPLLTEDDYIQGLRELESLPRDLTNQILSALFSRRALFLNISLYSSNHRLLLHTFYPQGVPRGSVAVLDPKDPERELWGKGVGMPGKNEGVDVVRSTADNLAAAIAEMAPQ